MCLEVSRFQHPTVKRVMFRGETYPGYSPREGHIIDKRCYSGTYESSTNSETGESHTPAAGPGAGLSDITVDNAGMLELWPTVKRECACLGIARAVGPGACLSDINVVNHGERGLLANSETGRGPGFGARPHTGSQDLSAQHASLPPGYTTLCTCHPTTRVYHPVYMPSYHPGIPTLCTP